MLGITRLKPYIRRLAVLLHRNQYGFKNMPSVRNTVNIEWYPLQNVGDTLGPVVVEWMLCNKSVFSGAATKRTKHLMSIGSVLSFAYFDATVWGSGVINEKAYDLIKRKKRLLHRKFDVRAVRGPLSREALIKAGYVCPEIYGDPAVLLPLVYTPVIEKKYDVSIIFHFQTVIENLADKIKTSLNAENVHVINVITDDYRFFSEEICASKRIISSSLHGLIIAESYGIPAVFFNHHMEDQLLKYRDWYLSTGRELTYCETIEEALECLSPPVPDLTKMQQALINSFPYDLWKNK